MLSIPFIVVVKCNKVPKFNKISIFYFIFYGKKNGKFKYYVFVKLGKVY